MAGVTAGLAYTTALWIAAPNLDDYLVSTTKGGIRRSPAEAIRRTAHRICTP